MLQTLMAARRLLSSRVGARFGAVAIVAAIATRGYTSKRSVAYCEAPNDQSALLYPQRYTSDLPRRRYLSAEQQSSNRKRGDAELIPELDKDELSTYRASFQDDDVSSWSHFSHNLNGVIDLLAEVQWSAIPDRITNFIVPSWARQMPEAIMKLRQDLSFAPGSLADEIWKEAFDQAINPEVAWDARVRVGSELSNEEVVFRKKRKDHVTKALARYLDLKEDIHPDDIPTIAMCGSGGGLRALVAGTSSYLSAQEAGLFDCVTCKFVDR